VVHLVRGRAELRAVLGEDRPGFVPTMGALHRGHAALIERAAAENRICLVSIFVNPTQFENAADLARYPRRFDDDLEVAERAGASLVWAPSPEEIYPPGFATTVEVNGLGDRWEGAARPGHFRGVATVVARLLGVVRPARAYFGEKDWQQLEIVRRLHADLALPGEIVGCPTVREADGLALASRNARLSPAGRAGAAVVPRTLARMAGLAATGERFADRLVAAGQAEIAKAGVPGLRVDYLAVVDGTTLEPMPVAGASARAMIAVTIEGIRLLDNTALPMSERGLAEFDEGRNDD